MIVILGGAEIPHLNNKVVSLFCRLNTHNNTNSKYSVYTVLFTLTYLHVHVYCTILRYHTIRFKNDSDIRRGRNSTYKYQRFYIILLFVWMSGFCLYCNCNAYASFYDVRFLSSQVYNLSLQTGGCDSVVVQFSMYGHLEASSIA